MASYILSFLTTILSGVLVFILQQQLKENRKLAKEREEEKVKRDAALENGMRQLLSVRLEEMYDQYVECESIPRRVYTRWGKLYEAYKGLNGNGTITHMNEEMSEKHIV